MAVKPYGKAILLLALVAGIAVSIIARSSHVASDRRDEVRYVSTYLKLSIARERFANQPDSLNEAISAIYMNSGADSIWMVQFSKEIAADLGRGEHVWGEITARLDSLRKAANIDSVIYN